MKKTLTAIAVSMLAVSAGAQDIYDAFNFGQNFYQGTARSIAMGNALTAVGGDLGSIGINPAGSAVAGYSQFTITPSVTLSTSVSDYTPVYGVTHGYQSSYSDSYSRAMLPNIGFTLDYKTGRKYGLKNVTFGMVSNMTNDYTMQMYSEGINNETTMSGALATSAYGIRQFNLAGEDAYYLGNPWNVVTAYQGGLITTHSGADNDYIGAAETIFTDGTIGLAGPVNQVYGAQRHGSKNDILFNVGLNFNDNLYVGANLGITALEYQYDNYLTEYAQDQNLFAIEYSNGQRVYFDNARNRYSYNAEGTGAYLKLGVIYKPLPMLRLGAAIQTPTLIDITERFQYATDTHFSDKSFDGDAYSPEGEYTYSLKTPFRANFGLAYNFFGVGMLSVDYELADYSSMEFRTIDYYSSSEFKSVNDDILDFAGLAHQVRVGAEFKPTPAIAIRAGYNLCTSPEYYYEESQKVNMKAPTNSYSAGMGYSSNGSFFADFACKWTKCTTSYIQPYQDYIDDTFSPEIRRNGNLFNIVATIGWRF